MPYSPPAYFKPILESEHYKVYENTRPLPFARTTSTVYSEESLKDASALDREHAMLQGVILDKKETLKLSMRQIESRIQRFIQNKLYMNMACLMYTEKQAA